MKKLFTLLTIITTLAASAQVPSYVPSDGLAGYWPFTGNANDVSGNGNNGTNNGATLTTDRNGNANSAYDFNYNGMQWNAGLHQATDIPYNSSFNSNTISVSIWFYARSYFFSGIPGLDKVSRLVTRCQYGYNNPNGQTWGIDLTNNQLTAFILQASTNNNQDGIVASTNVSLNQWNHVTFTFDNTTLKLFLNGILVSETPKPPTFSLNTIGNSGISVGCSNQANGYWYESDAKIDEFGFWNRALTQEEISNLYNASLPQTACLPANVPSTGLVSYWPFCGNANDESGNGNNGTVTGATLTTDRFGNDNSAYSFDGVNDFIICNNNNMPTQSMTISAWIYQQNSFANAEYICLGSANSTKWGLIASNNNINLNYGRGCSGSGGSNLTSSPINLGEWNHLVYVSSGVGGTTQIYKNGVLIGQTTANAVGSCSTQNLYFGVDIFSIPEYINGKLDDIGIWNRALTQEEITNLYNVNQCIINITVTDTLIINVGQLSFNEPVTYANNITIAPNPASSQININFNNITNLSGGTLKVINSLGQEVASTPITTSGTNSSMQLATWGGTGMYFVQIINPQGQIVDIKKIILQ